MYSMRLSSIGPLFHTFFTFLQTHLSATSTCNLSQSLHKSFGKGNPHLQVHFFAEVVSLYLKPYDHLMVGHRRVYAGHAGKRKLRFSRLFAFLSQGKFAVFLRFFCV